MTNASEQHPDTNFATPTKRLDLDGYVYSYCEDHMHKGKGMIGYLPAGDEPVRSETTDADRTLCAAAGLPCSDTTWTFKRLVFFFFPFGQQVMEDVRIIGDAQPQDAPDANAAKISVILARKLFGDDTLPAIGELSNDDKAFNSLLAIGMMAHQHNDDEYERTLGLDAEFVEADVMMASAEGVMVRSLGGDTVEIMLVTSNVIIPPGGPDPIICEFDLSEDSDDGKLLQMIAEGTHGEAPVNLHHSCEFAKAALLRDEGSGTGVITGKIIVMVPEGTTWTRKRMWVPKITLVNNDGEVKKGHEVAELVKEGAL